MPKTVSESVSKERSEEIKKLLEDAGAKVLIKWFPNYKIYEIFGYISWFKGYSLFYIFIYVFTVMFNLIFQASLLFFVFLSLFLVIGIPVVFASPNGWNENKNYVVLGVTAWTLLVFIVGILNYFVAWLRVFILMSEDIPF